MTKKKATPETGIEEVILNQKGFSLRWNTKPDTDKELARVIEKHEKWFKQVAERIKQQGQQIKQLSAEKGILLAPPVGKAPSVTVVPKDQKVLKCLECGATSPYATSDQCPVCGSRKVEWEG